MTERTPLSNIHFRAFLVNLNREGIIFNITDSSLLNLFNKNDRVNRDNLILFQTLDTADLPRVVSRKEYNVEVTKCNGKYAVKKVY
jgi:hypothetical protein